MFQAKEQRHIYMQMTLNFVTRESLMKLIWRAYKVICMKSVSGQKKWQLSFHPNKCKVMRLHVGRPKEQTKKYASKLEENSAPLEYVTQEKDLGLIIDENLSFEQHIGGKIKKANSIMGVIRRTMEHLDCYNFKLLFSALVRPHLEYANSVWSPHLVKFIDAVENVQRRATKQISGFGNLSYEDRLKKLKLPTLVYRRMRGDMIELFKF